MSELLHKACRPVFAVERTYARGHAFSFHAHDTTQLVFALAGTFSGRVANLSFSVPPGHGLLVSASVGHSLICPSGDLRICDVRFCSELVPADTQFRLVKVSTLAREIACFLAATPESRWTDPVVQRTGEMLLPHLHHVCGPWLNCPMPQDRRALRIARHILEHPEDMTTLDRWSRLVGASTRSLGRLFPQETGLSFTEWRSRAKLIEAIRRLEQGSSVQEVALDLGYDSTSAFSQMFRRVTGTAPSRYLKLAQ